ncbi:hypothetical protein PanWU01x14_322420 [Parasponia andersonii]|uniref:LRR domain containing protein n=1 Tax=Parasponia andersonii TaxID=3476 RepID=A0A2P5AKW8_PARAD|nr:hypothetical protein PanWU01x14_322420 [Parasponia andersonii]
MMELIRRSMLQVVKKVLSKFEVILGTQAPSKICELKNLQVLDGVEVGDALIKRLRHMTQLTRLGIT